MAAVEPARQTEYYGYNRYLLRGYGYGRVVLIGIKNRPAQNTLALQKHAPRANATARPVRLVRPARTKNRPATQGRTVAIVGLVVFLLILVGVGVSLEQLILNISRHLLVRSELHSVGRSTRGQR